MSLVYKPYDVLKTFGNLKLGSFYNDDNGNITKIANNGFFSGLGDYESKSSDTAYQAATDGYILAYAYTSSKTAHGVYTYVDENSSPTTERARFGSGNDNTHKGSSCVPVKAGDYYKVTDSAVTATVYWIPME